MAFLLSGIVCGLFVIGISVAHLVVQSGDVGTAALLSGWRTIGTLVVLIVTTAAIMPHIGLTGYHCRLIWLGRTTIEMVRTHAVQLGSDACEYEPADGGLGTCDRSGQSTRRTRMDPTRAVRQTHTAMLRDGTMCSGRSAGRWTCTLASSHMSMRARMPERRILHWLDGDGRELAVALILERTGKKVCYAGRAVRNLDSGMLLIRYTDLRFDATASAFKQCQPLFLPRDALRWQESSRVVGAFGLGEASEVEQIQQGSNGHAHIPI